MLWVGVGFVIGTPLEKCDASGYTSIDYKTLSEN